MRGDLHFGVEGATHTCPLVVWHSALFLLGFGSAFSIGVTNNGCFLFWNSFWIMISLGKAVCRKNFGRIFLRTLPSFLDLFCLNSFSVGSKSLFWFWFSFCDKDTTVRTTACGRRWLYVRQATVAGCGLHRCAGTARRAHVPWVPCLCSVLCAVRLDSKLNGWRSARAACHARASCSAGSASCRREAAGAQRSTRAEWFRTAALLG